MKYTELIAQMSLAEKASMCSGADFWHSTGIDRLNIPSMMLTDGPHGLRKQLGKADHAGLNKSVPATCFPTASCLANTWNTELIESVGECLGKEAAAEDVSVLLGPGLNIKRDPRCGRNFEYFSEDPYLSGKLAAALIRGIQSQGVSACAKHFAVNSQEHRRMGMDEIVDERALREIYLEGFRYAVTEGKPKCVMSSYNRVNGEFANENTHLMKEILREEWGYEGVVVTDWGGNNDRVAGLKAGNQLEMPGNGGMTDNDIVSAVCNGELDEAVLDEAVDKLLCLIFDTAPALGKGRSFEYSEHHALARKAAAEGAVLVKNEGACLPVTSGRKVAVIGDFAAKPRYQGAGSSLIVPVQLDSALEELKKTELDIIGYAPGYKRLGGESGKLSAQALELAEQAELILYFMGLDEASEAEGIDRSHLRVNDNQLELLDKLSSLGREIAVVFVGGAPVECGWISKANAVLLAYLGGEAGGAAIADLICGAAVPSGKLAESYPISLCHCPTANYYPGQERTSEHRESIYVGYRYYLSAAAETALPFGFGLSYSSFNYSGLRIDGNKVFFTVENTGSYDASEIAQLYVSAIDSRLFRPKRELKGFTKLFLHSGEKKEACITLDEHAFACWSESCSSWISPAGNYKIQIGASCTDIRLEEEIYREGDSVVPDLKKLPHYEAALVRNVPKEEFEVLLGRQLPPAHFDRSAPLGYTDTISQGEYKKGLSHALYKALKTMQNVYIATGRPQKANDLSFILNLPYRGIARMTNGSISMNTLDRLLKLMNRK